VKCVISVPLASPNKMAKLTV